MRYTVYHQKSTGKSGGESELYRVCWGGKSTRVQLAVQQPTHPTEGATAFLLFLPFLFAIPFFFRSFLFFSLFSSLCFSIEEKTSLLHFLFLINKAAANAGQ